MRLRLLLCVACLGCHRDPPRPLERAPVVATVQPQASSATTSSAVAVQTKPSTAVGVVGGDRPATVFVPTSYRDDKPMPLVVMLHGYGVSGDLVEWVFRLKPVAEKRGFLYVHPDGTANEEGKRYWNATDACCAPPGKGPDDVVYLRELVGEIVSKWSVDTKRIFLVGHSNGAIMAQRLACDHSDLFAAVVSVAGTSWSDASKCKPASPVSILEVHGTADATVRYEGGAFFGHAYPSARVVMERWAALDGCDKAPTAGGALDLDDAVAGPETKTLSWPHCRAGSAVELWSIEGGGHIPTPTDDFRTRALDFLFAHPKS